MSDSIFYPLYLYPDQFSFPDTAPISPFTLRGKCKSKTSTNWRKREDALSAQPAQCLEWKIFPFQEHLIVGMDGSQNHETVTLMFRYRSIKNTAKQEPTPKSHVHPT